MDVMIDLLTELAGGFVDFWINRIVGGISKKRRSLGRTKGDGNVI